MCDGAFKKDLESFFKNLIEDLKKFNAKYSYEKEGRLIQVPIKENNETLNE